MIRSIFRGASGKWGSGFREFWEKSIERVFKKLGYRIIYPESLSVDDQITLLNNCKYFAATEGSISHSSIFCKPRTSVVIIRKSHLVYSYQLSINEMADLNVTYIDAHRSANLNKAVPYYGPFYLCINRNLERYVGHKILHLPYWLDPMWYVYINHHRLQNWYNKIKSILKRLK